MNKDKWIANLSNGATVMPEDPIPGERTPWQKLLADLRTSSLEMTGLRLSIDGMTYFALPNEHCDGYFHAFELVQFYYRRTKRLMEGIGAVVGDKVYITWVCIDGDPFVYQDVRELNTCRIHTTLYEEPGNGQRLGNQDNGND